MIKFEKIKIILNSRHIGHFLKLGYKDIKPSQELQILTKELPENSNLKIDVFCDNCGVEKSVKYQDYNLHTSSQTDKYYCKSCNYLKNKITCLSKYGVDSHTKTQWFKDNTKNNLLSKYGVDHYSKTDEYKIKFKETCIEKYGVDNPFKSNYIKDKIKINKRSSMECKNLWIPTDLLSDFRIYKNKVRSLTRINIKKLNWNGYDFYDGEYIKDNYKYHHLNNKYPTIDHKISIYDGFNREISIEDISSLENLCYTKRIINITKNKSSY